MKGNDAMATPRIPGKAAEDARILRSLPPFERFIRKIETNREPDGCWNWRGSGEGHGYGLFGVKRFMARAHRVSYEYYVGPIAPGLQIDHLCRNRRCVRPDHLEPVTQRENILRGTSPSAANARKTECLRGHPLSGDNLYVDKKGGRSCRECTRQQGARKTKTGAAA
jgi:hypothetical protein